MSLKEDLQKAKGESGKWNAMSVVILMDTYPEPYKWTVFLFFFVN